MKLDRGGDVVGGHDVPVVKLGSHLCLAKKAGVHLLELPRGAEGLEPDALDRDLPPEDAVPGTNDLAERALAPSFTAGEPIYGSRTSRW